MISSRHHTVVLGRLLLSFIELIVTSKLEGLVFVHLDKVLRLNSLGLTAPTATLVLLLEVDATRDVELVLTPEWIVTKQCLLRH